MSDWFTPDRFQYDYVQAGAPHDPSEGETWYDKDDDTARVYDGGNWLELTVTDHSQLAGVSASDHHERPTTGANLTETDGGAFEVEQGDGSSLDADTVDGKHASELGGSANINGVSSGGTVDNPTLVAYGIEAARTSKNVAWNVTVDGTTHGDFLQPNANGYNGGEIVDSGCIPVESEYSFRMLNDAEIGYIYEMEFL